MRERSRIQTLGDVTFVLACVAIVVAVVVREVRRPAPATVSGPPARYLTQWHALLEKAVIIGPEGADVYVVEFGDLQCPACRTFHRTLRQAMATYPNTVAFAFLHFPLPQHPLAVPSAHALECADAQDAADSFIDVLYAKQDSLGLKDWDSFAIEANVPEPQRLADCIADHQPPDRVTEGQQLGSILGIQFTPTVLVNGWWFPAPPDSTTLVNAIQAIVEGRSPFENYEVNDASLH